MFILLLLKNGSTLKKPTVEEKRWLLIKHQRHGYTPNVEKMLPRKTSFREQREALKAPFRYVPPHDLKLETSTRSINSL